MASKFASTNKQGRRRKIKVWSQKNDREKQQHYGGAEEPENVVYPYKSKTHSKLQDCLGVYAAPKH